MTDAPWRQPTPGPIAVLTPPQRMRQLTRELRAAAARHDDTAWVHPRPPSGNSVIANLSADILDAIGAVGIHQPRTNGENHLLRPLVHLTHGPIRHLIVDDAAHLDPDTLTELHQVALAASTQLWLLIDTAERAVTRTSDYLQWANDTSTIRTPDHVTNQWATRPTPTPTCHLPDPTWWHQPLTGPLPTGCARHQDQPPINCLISWATRANTSNHVAAATVRRRLNEWLNHPDATIEDHWAAGPARREFYTAGADALAQLHPDATSATIGDITPDGTTVTLADGTLLPIEPMKRPALARLRSSRTYAGCLNSEPIIGFFDQEYGVRKHRRNTRTPTG